jgi:hypothetical protein
MTRLTTLASLVLVAALCAPAAVRADETAYPIKLIRPSKVGQKIKLEGDASQDMKITVDAGNGAQPAQAKTQSVAFVGQGEILEVAKDGRTTKMSYTFTTLKTTTPQGSAEPLPKDAVVIAELKNGKTEFSLKSGILSPAAQEVLPMVVALDGGSRDDEIFGADKARKVGESWDINAAAMADDLKAKELEVDATKLSGKTTLVGVKNAGDVKCLELKAAVQGTGVQLPMGQLPPGMVVEKSQLQGTMTGLFPVDIALPAAQQAAAAEFEIHLAPPPAPGNPAIKIVVTGKVTHNETVTPVK